MNQILTIATILLFAAPLAAQPVEAQPVENQPVETAPQIGVSGFFFSRYELRDGYAQVPVLADDVGSDLVRYRAQLGLDIGVLDGPLDVDVRFVPQAGGFWYIGGDDLVDPVLGLHEGVVEVSRNGFALEVGRFEMVYGDHLVIGNVGWHHLGRAFDGVRASFDAGDATVDVFATVLDEGVFRDPALVDPVGAGDTYFTGVYGKLGGLIGHGLELDLYALSRIRPGNDAVTDEMGDPLVAEGETSADVTPGVRFKGRAGVVDFRLETGLQLGTRSTPGTDAADVFAYHVDAEVGLDLRKTAHVRVSAEGFYASGDDPETPEIEAWDQLYPTAHKWMGLMDVVGARSNIYGGVAHLQSVFGPVAVGLDTHVFFRPFPADGDDYLGTELDLGAAWTIAKPITLRGLYGIFIAEEENYQFVEIAFETKF